MLVYAIILNYNGFELTLKCLESLYKSSKTNFTLKIVVVDNGSTDGSANNIRRAYPDVEFIASRENLGFSGGNNLGIRKALDSQADYIFILNNDARVGADTIDKLAETGKNLPKAGILGPKIYFQKHHETHPDRYAESELGRVIWYAGGKIDWDNMLVSHRGVDEADKNQYQESVKTSFVTGCAMFVKSEVFRRTGMFDEKFYLYYEDVDFCLRARRQHYEVYYIPEAVVWHANAGSSGGTGNRIQDYYMTRNRLLMGMRWAPWRTKLALLREATNILIRGNSVRIAAVGDFLRKKYGPQTQDLKLNHKSFFHYFKRKK